MYIYVRIIYIYTQTHIYMYRHIDIFFSSDITSAVNYIIAYFYWFTKLPNFVWIYTNQTTLSFTVYLFSPSLSLCRYVYCPQTCSHLWPGQWLHWFTDDLCALIIYLCIIWTHLLTFGSYNHKFTQENDFVWFPPPSPYQCLNYSR